MDMDKLNQLKEKEDMMREHNNYLAGVRNDLTDKIESNNAKILENQKEQNRIMNHIAKENGLK